MRVILVYLWLFLLINNLFSQTQYKIFGHIRDASSGEPIIGATVWLKQSHDGTTSNSQGYFNLALKQPHDTLMISCIGYKSRSLPINNVFDTLINVALLLDTIEEVIVKRPLPDHLQRSQTGLELLSSHDVKTLPVVMGESDITRTLLTLPGVTIGTENTAGFFVRGGSHDQNLILIDDVPLYHAYHLYGFFSVFNTDAINTTQFYRGGIPSQYNSRLSSVLDIRMNEGNNQRLSGQMTLGPIASKALLEGPIIKNKTAFLVTARRSMFDLLPKDMTYNIAWISGIDQSKRDIQQIPQYYFSDYSGKVSHQLNGRNSINISFYNAVDKYSGPSGFISNMELNWGSTLFSLRWKSILSASTFCTATFYETTYTYSSTSYPNASESNYFSQSSRVTERAATVTFESLLNRHRIKYGTWFSWYRLKPRAISKYRLTEQNLNIDTTYGASYWIQQQSVYAEDIISLTPRFTLNIGANINRHVADGQDIVSVHPRLSVGYEIIDGLTIKGSYTSLQQPLHALQTTSLGSPSDLWVPAIHAVPPAEGKQYVVGLSYRPLLQWEIGCEAYYKEMNKIVMYREGVSAFANPTQWESLIDVGKGTSKGIELTITKKYGKLTGWCSYTLSKSDRQVPNINYGRTFPSTFDRRHVLNMAIIAQLSKKITIGSTWTYQSGQPVTLGVMYIPNETEGVEGSTEFIPSLNNYRLPDYHRLDVNINYHTFFKKLGFELNIGAYNVYNRANPYSVISGPEGISVNYLFPILPYFNITFKY